MKLRQDNHVLDVTFFPVILKHDKTSWLIFSLSILQRCWILDHLRINSVKLCVVSFFQSRKLSKLDEPDTQDTAGEAGTSS